jgi:hypothetical protein
MIYACHLLCLKLYNVVRNHGTLLVVLLVRQGVVLYYFTYKFFTRFIDQHPGGLRTAVIPPPPHDFSPASSDSR